MSVIIYNKTVIIFIITSTAENCKWFRKEMGMKEKIYVEIAGVKLGILTEDGADYVNQIASRVNDDIKSLMKSQRNCSLIEAALFCSMNYCSQGGEDSMKVKNLETQVALYQANLNRMRKENEELRSKLAGEQTYED